MLLSIFVYRSIVQLVIFAISQPQEVYRVTLLKKLNKQIEHLDKSSLNVFYLNIMSVSPNHKEIMLVLN